jgi:hypothetical protein
MAFTKAELHQMAEHFSEAAALRDLNNTEGWETLAKIAKRRIEQQSDAYLRQEFSRDEAWEARTELRAIKQFWAMIEEMVATAYTFVDQEAIKELIYSSQDNASGGQGYE